MAKRRVKTTRVSRSIEDREKYHTEKLKQLQVRKQIEALRASLRGPAKK